MILFYFMKKWIYEILDFFLFENTFMNG